MTKKEKHLKAAHKILITLGMPRAQQNERSALCLLALLNLIPGKPWSKAEAPLMGITPIMDWIREHYQKKLRAQFTGNNPPPDHPPVYGCGNCTL